MPGSKKNSPNTHNKGGREEAFPIVAIGASAGGLEALEAFFDKMPPETGMAFVIIQHLSPEGKSMLGDILKKHTRMTIFNVEDGMRPEPNRVYLNPPGKDVSLSIEFLVSKLAAPQTLSMCGDGGK